MKNWTAEEEEYLYERAGDKSIEGIAKHLGRSYDSVISKMNKLGIRASDTDVFITAADLCRTLNISRATFNYWIKSRGLKYRKIGKYLKISPVTFFEWAEANKTSIDWSKVDPLIFGKEPKWVNECRKRDNRHFNTSRKWTSSDDAQLRFMCQSQRYTYHDICERLDRSHSAVRRRAYDLYIDERPIRTKLKKYTPEEIQKVIKMRENGKTFQECAEAINGNARYLSYRYNYWVSPEYRENQMNLK